MKLSKFRVNFTRGGFRWGWGVVHRVCTPVGLGQQGCKGGAKK